MFLKIMAFVWLFCLPFTAYSRTKSTVKVKGMVCAFCAQGVKKGLSKRPEVSRVSVDLDQMLVHIEYEDGKTLPEQTVKTIIESSGFAYVGLNHEKL